MKNIKLTLIAIIGLGSFTYAGGDISPVTPYEVEDTRLAEEAIIKSEVKSLPVVPPVVKKEIKSNRGIYIGIGGVIAQYDTNCKCSSSTKSGKDKTAGVIGKVGYDFNKYIGVESRAMITKLKDDGGTIKHLGVFAKPMLPVGDNLNIYALAGLAKTTTQGSLRRTDVDGFAWGVGVEYDLSENISASIDYEKLFQKSDAPKLDAINVGVNYKFNLFYL